MKLIRNILDKTKPKVKEGKKPGFMYWVHDSLETFAFTPNHVTKNGTHIKDGIDMKRTMFLVIIALQPCLLFGMWNLGHQYYVGMGEEIAWTAAFWPKIWFGLVKMLPLIVVSYGAGLLVEYIFCWVKGHEINEGFLVSGMLIPLIMPVDVPLWMVAVSAIFAVIIGKEVFGGTGMNILNVALTARAFLFFAYPTKMTGNTVWVAAGRDDKGALVEGGSGVAHTVPAGQDLTHYTGDIVDVGGNVVGTYDDGFLTSGIDAYTGETPLGYMFNSVASAKTERLTTQAMETFSASDTTAIQEALATITEMQHLQDVAVSKMPTFWEAFVGVIPGSTGETSAIMCLMGAGLLIATRIGSWRVMLSMLLGGYVMGLIFNAIGMNPYMDVPAHMQIVLGGFMFGMVFMATDPVTAAQTTRGKWIYGFFCGLFAIAIRVFNPAYPEGVMLAILFMNVMAPLIDHYVVKANINRRLARAKKKAVAHA